MYRVYTLTNGLVEDICETESLSDAYEMYEAAIGIELIRKDKSDTYAETTVHLWDGYESSNAPIAEYYITAKEL